ncbi:hypothetical protein TWF281_004812 [Arthrobotrys megalospora]
MSELDFSLIDLAQEALPVVSRVAAQLGEDTKNQFFGRLSYLLTFTLITIETLPSLPLKQAEAYEKEIKLILKLLEKACTWPKTTPNQRARVPGNPTAKYPTLEAIAKTRGIRELDKISRESKIYYGLKEFFSEDAADLLFTLLADPTTTEDPTADDMGLSVQDISRNDNVPGYPSHVNKTLYFTLGEHTSCGCRDQHLKLARLRFDMMDEYEKEDVPFKISFSTSPAHHQERFSRDGIWHETMILVRKRAGKKIVLQRSQYQPSRTQDLEGTELSIGELCKHLEGKINVCLKFNIALEGSCPILRVGIDTVTPLRYIQSATGISFTDFLQTFRTKMSKIEKFRLAYILAKSVWQYYGSDWMRDPWTHEDIQFLEEHTDENSEDSLPSSYGPYLAPNFAPSDTHTGEFYSEGLLIHRYPGILSLGVMLIDIIKGRLSPDFQGDQPYTYRKIRECYTLASIAKNDLDCDVVYKAVVERCLDRKLFENAQFNPSDPQDGLETRQAIIYKEIVAPLKYLLAIPNVGSRLRVGESEKQNSYSHTSHVQTENRTKINPDHDPNAHRRSLTHSIHQPASHSYHRRYYNPGSPVPPNLSLRTRGIMTASPHSRIHPRPSNRNEFEIAIICALKPEYEAVELLIDHFWDDDEGEPYRRAPGDENTYKNGRIGEHNVVLLLLPGIGKAHAAKASASLRSSYRRLQLTLLVGVCGGVPRYGGGAEVILGDVVISRSIVQYDLGRRFPNEFRSRMVPGDIFETTNADIRAFLGTMETCRNLSRLESRTLHHLGTIQRKPHKEHDKYNYPGVSEDRLYDSASRHKHHHTLNCNTCNRCIKNVDPVCDDALEMLCTELQCDERQIVSRRRLRLKEGAPSLRQVGTIDSQQPTMHFGRMASGDTVMKSGIDRDMIARQHNVIAFEMEGAGIWDNLPCIIIKGVCDYADCHKNKKWQNFAAATAASAMKALLEQYNGTDRC